MWQCHCGGSIRIIFYKPHYRGRCERCMCDYPARKWEYDQQVAHDSPAPQEPPRAVEVEQISFF